MKEPNRLTNRQKRAVRAVCKTPVFLLGGCMTWLSLVFIPYVVLYWFYTQLKPPVETIDITYQIDWERKRFAVIKESDRRYFRFQYG